MSKLSHSNTDTMNEIELNNHGITKLPPPPKPPRCEAKTPPKWYRKRGGRCPYQARWVTHSGVKLCKIHAKKSVEENNP